MSTETHVLELLPDYALGCLDEDEADLVARHLAGCPLCRAEAEAYQAVAGQLALAAPDVAPPPHLKERLMERVRTSRPAAPAQPRAPWWRALLPAWGLVSLLLILALAAGNLLLWQRANRPEVVVGPAGLRAIPLSSTEAAPGAGGFILIGADGQNGALVVDKLPVLDAAQQYQLWLIRDGQRTSGAVFSVDENGYGGTRVSAPESLLEYSAVGITIEPAGGSPGPTGDRVLGGQLPNP